MLGDGGASTDAAALHIAIGGELDGVPIETVVLEEARVLCGDDGVLKVGRYLIEGNELVTLAIGLALHPGLYTALDARRLWVGRSNGKIQE